MQLAKLFKTMVVYYYERNGLFITDQLKAILDADSIK